MASPEAMDEAIATLQAQYGVDPRAFLRVIVANRIGGVKVIIYGTDYQLNKGPIRQHMSADDWERRKSELETEIQKHVHCDPCVRMGMFVPVFCCISFIISQKFCPDDGEDIDRIVDETVQSWNMKDAGRIHWTLTRPNQFTTRFDGVELMARDLPATSMLPAGGPLFAVGAAAAAAARAAAAPAPATAPPAELATSPAVNLISTQPPSYDAAVVAIEPDEVTKPTS